MRLRALAPDAGGTLWLWTNGAWCGDDSALCFLCKGAQPKHHVSRQRSTSTSVGYISQSGTSISYAGFCERSCPLVGGWGIGWVVSYVNIRPHLTSHKAPTHS